MERALQAATPIALAAIGGLYAEKSGVFNIGLEGFMIFGALFGAVTAWTASGSDGVGQADLWLGVLTAMVVCGLMAALFAVLLIRYEADQIVAGLAVWFIGLGFGPFISTVVWGGVSSPSLPNIDNVVVPVLSEVPIAGRLFFDASPLVLFTVVLAVGAWIVLFRTRYGYWVQAAGENPEALDTAGVDVNRVRYATLVFSGVMAGLGGAVLSIGIGSGFTGTGVTMVDGRGWIAIVAYLFGNYNPLGTYGASLLFGAMDMLQIQLQTIGISLPGSITGLFPYVAVLVVLVVVGYTRVPAAVGEPYSKED
nr:ABC transporter permease [Halorubrum sp. GN11_10-6_MGM]